MEPFDLLGLGRHMVSLCLEVFHLRFMEAVFLRLLNPTGDPLEKRSHLEAS
jgi:hypothetical protein